MDSELVMQKVADNVLLEPCIKSKRKLRQRDKTSHKQRFVCFANNLQGEISQGVYLEKQGDENLQNEEHFSDNEYFNDDLEYSNWKKGCNFCRSVGKQAKPKVKPHRKVKVANKNKTFRKSLNVTEHCVARKENNQAKLNKAHIQRFGDGIYQKRSDPDTIKPNNGHLRSRINRKPPVNNKVDHPNALKYELKKDNAVKEGNQGNMIVDLQHRDITPEDYELLLLLDDSVAKRTVSTNFLTALKVVIVSHAGLLGDICAICMDAYIETERVKELPCSHMFHEKCIDNWLSNASPNCPLDGVSVQT